MDEMSFTWIPLYSEIARKVLEFETRQDELIALLGRFAAQGLQAGALAQSSRFAAHGLQVGALDDLDAEGRRFLLTEIDPFTFFATFNWQGRKPEKTRPWRDIHASLLAITTRGDLAAEHELVT